MTRLATRLKEHVSWRMKRLSFLARHEFFRKPPYLFRYYGYNVMYSPGDSLVRAFSINGFYEPKITALLPALLRPGAVVFDAGANIGFFGLAVLGMIPQSSVHMFEPSPAPRGNLVGTVNINCLKGRARVIAAAVYAEPGEMSFVIHSERFAAYDGFRDTQYSGAGKAQTIKVPVTTIDRYVEDLGITRLDLLKLDVEGAEFFVLQGARRTLQGLRPVVLFEVGYQNLAPYELLPSDLYRYLKNCGYAIKSLRQQTLSEVVFSHACVNEHEFLAFPEETAASSRTILEIGRQSVGLRSLDD